MKTLLNSDWFIHVLLRVLELFCIRKITWKNNISTFQKYHVNSLLLNYEVQKILLKNDDDDDDGGGDNDDDSDNGNDDNEKL